MLVLVSIIIVIVCSLHILDQCFSTRVPRDCQCSAKKLCPTFAATRSIF